MKYFIIISIGVSITFGYIFFFFINNQKSYSVQASVSETSEEVEIDDISTLENLDTSNFSEIQLEVLSVLKQEYVKHPTSFDDTVLKYTEGFEESWCGDFISWVFNEAGSPFISQDASYWRIPGVYTLQEYYDQYGLYYSTSNYTPEFGDIAFYFGETPDGGSSQHVAIVLAVQDDNIITIGGNEGDDGILQIRSDSYNSKGLEGFGASGL